MTYPMLPGFEADSDTSQAAATSIAPSRSSMLGRALRELQRAEDGLTSDELEQVTGWRHQTASARLRELVLFGLAYDSATRRRTGSGRWAVVRRVTVKGNGQ